MEQQTIPFNLEYFRAGNKAYLKESKSYYQWIADRPGSNVVVVDQTEFDMQGSSTYLTNKSVKFLEEETYMHPPAYYAAINSKFGICLSREIAEWKKAGLYSNSPSVIIIELTPEQHQAIQEEMNKTTKPEQI
jgi:hypothetical protein